MCGIAGQVAGDRRPVEPRLIAAMGHRLRHRGPDDHGTYVKGHVGLAHRRLSVLDLSQAGHQPMSNDNGTVWIVFNGEVYNFRELRDSLRSRYTFRSGTDTEVVLHLYEEYGLQCLPMLRGMFAFAVWDELAQRLVLVRDRLGVKPLFYAVKNGGLAFASELKALLVGGSVPDIDPVAVHHYLTFQYVPTPMTIFQGIYKLRPGHVLVYEGGKLSESSYWSLQYDRKQEGRSEAEYCEEFTSLLRESVRLRLVSDVPLGAFLSGGLDSSSVVALMSQEIASPVRTFSVGFHEESFNELPYAREVAIRFATDHRELLVEPLPIEILPRLVQVYDEPYADSSAIPMYYMAQLSRQSVTVILTGDGGDELLAGYPRYRFNSIDRLLFGLLQLNRGTAAASDQVRKVLAGLRSDRAWFPGIRGKLERLVEPLSLRYLRRICYFLDHEKDQLYEPAFSEKVRGHASTDLVVRWFHDTHASDLVDHLLGVDTRSYLPDDLLVKLDRATMAHGLEARSPFLDHRLVEFVASLPVHLKIRRGRTKYLLKTAMRDVLPDRILDRKKQGFLVPIDRWFRGDCRDFLRESLLSERCLGRGYFRPDRIRKLLDNHQQTESNHGYGLYALLMLELWHREYVDGASV